MPEKSKEILFSGTGLSPLTTFKKDNESRERVSTAIQTWVAVTSTDEGKRLYGEHGKGATVEQAWRTTDLLSGAKPLCLAATDKAPISTDAIKKVIKMDSKQIVNTLSKILSRISEGFIPILYYDGRIGHGITLHKYDINTSRFIYDDSWPGASLLCKENNAAQIDAIYVKRNLWSITSAELEKVIVAAFVYQFLWAAYNGEKYYLTFDEFKSSHFWDWFGIRETDRYWVEKETFLKDGVYRTTCIELEPGGYQSEIGLGISLDQRQRLQMAWLNVKRRWLIGPSYVLNVDAFDIVSWFFRTLTPPPEQQQRGELISELAHFAKTNPMQRQQRIKDLTARLQSFRELSDLIELVGLKSTNYAEQQQRISELSARLTHLRKPSFVQQKILKKTDNPSLIDCEDALLTYLGLQEVFWWPLDFSWVYMKNVREDEVDWLNITILILLD